MRSLAVILSMALIVSVCGVRYIDRSIDLLVAEARIVNSEPETPQTASTLLTIEDTGYNSAGDALQTVAGVNLYQNASYIN